MIRDRAFNFYYPGNLEALTQEGAELIFIDSLSDRLPAIDGFYIGGGLPSFSSKPWRPIRDYGRILLRR